MKAKNTGGIIEMIQCESEQASVAYCFLNVAGSGVIKRWALLPALKIILPSFYISIDRQCIKINVPEVSLLHVYSIPDTFSNSEMILVNIRAPLYQ